MLWIERCVSCQVFINKNHQIDTWNGNLLLLDTNNHKVIDGASIVILIYQAYLSLMKDHNSGAPSKNQNHVSTVK